MSNMLISFLSPCCLPPSPYLSLHLPSLLQKFLTSRDWETGQLPNQLPFLALTGETICDFWVRWGNGKELGRKQKRDEGGTWEAAGHLRSYSSSWLDLFLPLEVGLF